MIKDKKESSEEFSIKTNQDKEEEEEVNYKDFEGLDEDWEDFNST